MHKIIFHLDINYFFAQVEELLNPYLKNKPVVVCNNKYKGIILTSNYVARSYGIKAPQKIYDAKKKCNELLVVSSNFFEYQLYSKKFFQCIAKNFTNEIEYYSIDECYIDVTELIKKFHNNTIMLANEIYKTVLKDTGLKISIGIGDNKFLAKTANDISDKKLFYYELYKHEIIKKLYPIKINEIFFVGKKTAKYFEYKKIKTVEDFINFPNQYELANELKSRYGMLMNFFSGESSDQLDLNNDENKSISLSETFNYSTSEYKFIKNKILDLSTQVYHKLKIQNLIGNTYTLKLRLEDKKVVSRSISINKKINDEKKFCNIFVKLLNQYWDNDVVDQVSVGINKLFKQENFYSIKQLNLFDN